MAPSRGLPTAHAAKSSDDVAVQQQSDSALISARRNFNYLVNPAGATPAERPGRLRTRALLRTTRYLLQFVFWRIVRWARFAAVGALAAALGATALGGVVTGVGWIAAPPTIGASIVAAIIWGIGKFAAKKLHKRWEQTGRDQGEAEREHQADRPADRINRQMAAELGPSTIPW